jgi:hypothetical protein
LSGLEKALNRRGLLSLAVIGVIASAFVVWGYGCASFWPGLIAGFLGTLFAFLLALAWDREQARQRLERETTELETRRVTEARRRFAVVQAELRKNEKSLEALDGAFQRKPGSAEEFRYRFAPVNPQLLEGAWTASAPRLSELVADYELIADLATVYGRIEELRWRLRFRTEHTSALLD